MNISYKAGLVLDRIVEEFKSGETLPRFIAKALITVPDTPSAKWSRNNRLIQAIFDTADSRGYRQWQAVGRKVKKGSKAIYILVPQIIQVPKDEEEAKKEKEDQETISRLVGFNSIPVFRFEDTEGKDIPTYKPKTIPPLVELAKKEGINVRYENSDERYGSYNGKTITLSTESPDTFLHELMHHYDSKSYNLKDGQDPTQECVAQLGACVLASMCGHNCKAYTAAYISHYIGTKTPDQLGMMCLKITDRVMKAVDLILGDAEKLQIRVAVA